jgi:cyclopropane-fatty-acyl-phospholipid synthase
MSATSPLRGTAAPAAPRPERRRVERLLHSAGIRVGGAAPWDMQVHDARFYRRVLAEGSLGLGESYMDGWWDARSLEGCMEHILRARLDERVRTPHDLLLGLRARLLDLYPRRASRVARMHYDLGNELFAAMLGGRMIYSCGYWAHATSLEQAQVDKLELVARKLALEPGMEVLDIGCGWGEALRHMAQRHGVTITGITVSKEQAEYAHRLCQGLPVTVKLRDYRDLHGRFDRIFSIGMYEHVGARDHRRYFETVRRCLKDDGLTLLHTIGANVSSRHTDPWIERYIFPDSALPSAAQITRAYEGLFVLEDWHGFGPDYARTLQAWRRNIESAWSGLPARYDERFRRMWRYYLAASTALFRTRRAQVWQILLSPHGVPGGCPPVR